MPPKSAHHDASMARKFADFHAANPRIWEMFVRFTAELIHRGFQNNSAYAVMHRVRWETAVASDDADETGFKISNGWIPYYARLFHLKYPQHDGFFRTRPAAADVEMANDGH